MANKSASSGEAVIYLGQFSDGQSARITDVKARLVEQGVEIFHADDNKLLGGWPLEELESSVFLQVGEPVHLGNKTLPGARLFVPNIAGQEADFARELIALVPQLSRKRANSRVLIGLVSAAAILLVLIVGLVVSDFSLSETIARQVPEKVRKSFGNQVVASLSGGKSACSSPEGNKAFSKLVTRLSEGAGQVGKFDIQVMPLGMMNAFAAPGERIVVSKKLIDFVDSPEELAGVIAHEMGHGMKMHPEAGIVRALGISAGISIAFGGSSGSLGDIGAMLVQLKYSRTAETQADTIALSILQAAQIPAKPFASFFSKLEKRHGWLGEAPDDDDKDQGKDKDKDKSKDKKKKKKKSASKADTTIENGLEQTLNIFSTHPATPERVKMITSAPEWKTRPLLSGAEWKALGRICDK